MSNYHIRAIHPVTGNVEKATASDNHYGAHRYGVVFADGSTYPIEKVFHAHLGATVPKPAGGFGFDRYVDGVLMAEGVVIKRADTLAEAVRAATALAPRSGGKATVLVLREKPPAPMPPTPGGWQPIETAPRDGTHVLVAFTIGGMGVAGWDRQNPEGNPWRVQHMNAWFDEDSVCGWMPLPEPPEVKP